MRDKITDAAMKCCDLIAAARWGQRALPAGWLTPFRRRSNRMLVSIICGSVMLSGCLNYSINREFGDYYNSTKTIWNDPCIHSNDWFFDVKFGSLGQTIGYSGLFLAIYGIVITGPVGQVVHEVEKVTLSPVVDTLYLPIDLCFRNDYLNEQKKEEKK